MGGYEEVLIKCPSCDKLLLEQTKWGECILNSYSVNSTPIFLVAMKNNTNETKLYCENCSEPIKVNVKFIVDVQVDRGEWLG